MKNKFSQLTDKQILCEFLNLFEKMIKLYGMQEVIGSTPIFSTLIISHLHEIVSGFFIVRVDIELAE
jgi:hypothetical protein